MNDYELQLRTLTGYTPNKQADILGGRKMSPQAAKLANEMTHTEGSQGDTWGPYVRNHSFPYRALANVVDMFGGGNTEQEYRNRLLENYRTEQGDKIEPAFMGMETLIAPAMLKAPAMAKGTLQGLARLAGDEQTFINAVNNLVPFQPNMGMTAYHGSPHKFSKFSIDNIGTGEGAQAYGHGLYFAESPNTGIFYKEALTPTGGMGGTSYNIGDDIVKQVDLDPKDVDTIEQVIAYHKGNVDKAYSEAKDQYTEAVKRMGADNPSVMKFKEYLDRLSDFRGRNLSYNTGYLYEVDIPDEHVKNFLDWDAPLSEQPHVLDALKKSRSKIVRETLKNMESSGFKYSGDLGEYTGETLNRMLSLNFDGIPNSKKASEALNKVGIKGIKYYDGMSRGAGDGTRNLVIFDDSIVKTLTRNGEAIE